MRFSPLDELQILFFNRTNALLISSLLAGDFFLIYNNKRTAKRYLTHYAVIDYHQTRLLAID